MIKIFTAYLIVLITNFTLSVVVSAAEVKLETDEFKFYKFEGGYEDARVNLDYAITGRGIKINGVSHISNMLVRTGKDIGRTHKIFGHAEAIQFCSATLSRNMMEADPMNIIYCPYIVYIYSLPTDSNTVYLGYRKPSQLGSQASKASKKAIEYIVKTYEGIIADAM